MKLLCLSNGHGEDEIAVRILEELQHQAPTVELAALPLVGEGGAYQRHNIPVVGAVKQMPSGGFIYMDGKQLWRDVKQGGLLQLVWQQYRAIRQWVQSSSEQTAVLAVGDFVPLLFAYLAGVPYAFVGTARSEYYLRDEGGWLSAQRKLEAVGGSVYHPCDRWLMGRRRCKAVFPRDSLTAQILQEKGQLPVFDSGNPMMDGIESEESAPIFYRPNIDAEEEARSLTILLLPGSRALEAYENWEKIAIAVREIASRFRRQSILFLAAIAPSLSLEPLSATAMANGFQRSTLPEKLPIVDRDAMAFSRDGVLLILTQNAYRDCLLAADFAVAMAGTATEQFVGLGKPAIAIPGRGPQYTYAFAEAQSRLLGCSLILVQKPQEVAEAIQTLLADPDRLQAIAENGRRRMGTAGAARRIAECLNRILL
ncbi:lipid-A-disaccharide synthase-related protein [Oscillatoria sp. FACHB-1406]|uniref:lipid-A-disaccharide synthase-related protein n=1 Tax=Oscillatoria sp. FACHB-1406 TaxID=2692846 RepID=UPI001688EEDC|nr:lipid-A-disaccharide synthase-related protein [Oscillatoria sp. FACHB-1406]MBD2579193.1 hypothetical protein [Oscillatoria sp. FACHB-1406]